MFFDPFSLNRRLEKGGGKEGEGKHHEFSSRYKFLNVLSHHSSPGYGSIAEQLQFIYFAFS